jgi:hypothetical protein
VARRAGHPHLDPETCVDSFSGALTRIGGAAGAGVPAFRAPEHVAAALGAHQYTRAVPSSETPATPSRRTVLGAAWAAPVLAAAVGAPVASASGSPTLVLAVPGSVTDPVLGAQLSVQGLAEQAELVLEGQAADGVSWAPVARRAGGDGTTVYLLDRQALGGVARLRAQVTVGTAQYVSNTATVPWFSVGLSLTSNPTVISARVSVRTPAGAAEQGAPVELFAAVGAGERTLIRTGATTGPGGDFVFLVPTSELSGYDRLIATAEPGGSTYFSARTAL